MRFNEIKCTNARGDSLVISNSSVYKLIEGLDTTGAKADISYIKNFRTQGAVAVSSRLGQRDFSLLFFIDVQGRLEDWIQEKRNEVFKVFNPLYNPVRLNMKNANQSIFIDANVELTPSIASGVANMNDTWQKVMVQFSAGNPFFQDSEVKRAEIATWVPLFEFPLEIPAEGIEMGQRTPSLIVNVLNTGQVETGMIIQFKALGSVRNPSLANVNTQEFIKINRLMAAGEVVTVNTNSGKKRVESELNAMTTNIFNNLEFGSKFMQLAVGDNLFRYAATENQDNLEVSIYFTPQYLGV